MPWQCPVLARFHIQTRVRAFSADEISQTLYPGDDRFLRPKQLKIPLMRSCPSTSVCLRKRGLMYPRHTPHSVIAVCAYTTPSGRQPKLTKGVQLQPYRCTTNQALGQPSIDDSGGPNHRRPSPRVTGRTCHTATLRPLCLPSDPEVKSRV